MKTTFSTRRPRSLPFSKWQNQSILMPLPIVLIIVWLTLAIGNANAQDPTRLEPAPPTAPNQVATPAQATTSNSLRPDAGQQLISQGLEFEKQGRWGEAFSFYQSALKKHPKNQSLQSRRNIARLHFDLERRYSDSGYLETLRSASGTRALQVYAEILAKIQSYYVDEPSWQSLVNHGAASLEIAIHDPAFQRTNMGSQPNRTQLKKAMTSIRSTLRNYPGKKSKRRLFGRQRDQSNRSGSAECSDPVQRLRVRFWHRRCPRPVFLVHDREPIHGNHGPD